MNRTVAPLPAWVETAAYLPIAFAQVREDPILDSWAASQVRDDYTAVMIASGGCTAAWLASQTRPSRLHLVDANPAQMALTRLKLELLTRAPSSERRRILGHAVMEKAERVSVLAATLLRLGLATEALGVLDVVGTTGPDHAGRYESVFCALRQQLEVDGVTPQAVETLLSRSTKERHQLMSPDSALGRTIDAAFDRSMSIDILVRLFGEGATRNPVVPFARHFAHRTRLALIRDDAAQNPYLWQVLRGEFPLRAPNSWLDAAAPTNWPEITWSVEPMLDALRAEPSAFDVVHLSNILDWLNPEEARETLVAAARALRPGGVVILRQLNSTLDIRAVRCPIAWDTDASDELSSRDRSYFYSAIHFGRRA